MLACSILMDIIFHMGNQVTFRLVVRGLMMYYKTLFSWDSVDLHNWECSLQLLTMESPSVVTSKLGCSSGIGDMWHSRACSAKYLVLFFYRIATYEFSLGQNRHLMTSLDSCIQIPPLGVGLSLQGGSLCDHNSRHQRICFVPKLLWFLMNRAIIPSLFFVFWWGQPSSGGQMILGLEKDG